MEAHLHSHAVSKVTNLPVTTTRSNSRCVVVVAVEWSGGTAPYTLTVKPISMCWSLSEKLALAELAMAVEITNLM